MWGKERMRVGVLNPWMKGTSRMVGGWEREFLNGPSWKMGP